MTEKSSAELEREAEAVRAQMTQTADTLQQKLSPGQLVDEMTSYFKNSDGRVALDNFKSQVRDNPLPLALVGAGLAWLFMGGGPSSDRLAMQRRSRFERTDFGRYQNDYPEGHWEGDARDGERAGDSMRRMASGSYSSGSGFGEEKSSDDSMMDRVSSAYSSAADAASSAADTISETASSAAEAISDTASRSWQRMRDTRHYASDSMHDAGNRAQRMMSDTLDKEPLILGAIGLAVGAAIGAMMPRTRVEEEYLRPYAEKASETVKDVAQQGMEEVRNVASKVYDETFSDNDKSSADQGSKSSQGREGQKSEDRDKLASTQPSSSGAGSAASKASASGTNATTTGPDTGTSSTSSGQGSGSASTGTGSSGTGSTKPL